LIKRERPPHHLLLGCRPLLLLRRGPRRLRGRLGKAKARLACRRGLRLLLWGLMLLRLLLLHILEAWRFVVLLIAVTPEESHVVLLLRQAVQ
jgi:hypothetical protein